MRKNRGMRKTQEYTFEVVGRFVYCDGIYRTSSEVQCEIVSCLLINSKRSVNMKNINLNFSPKTLQTSPGSPPIMTNTTMK